MPLFLAKTGAFNLPILLDNADKNTENGVNKQLVSFSLSDIRDLFWSDSRTEILPNRELGAHGERPRCFIGEIFTGALVMKPRFLKTV